MSEIIAPGRRWRRKDRAERPMVPQAEFTSYYGKPVLNQPVWGARDVAGYFFLGGLAGGSSLLVAAATRTSTGRLELRLRRGKTRARAPRTWCHSPRSFTTWGARQGSST